MQLGYAQLVLEPVPNSDGQVLRGRNLVRELRHFFVEMAVVQRINDLAVQDFLQLLQVHNKAGLGIDLSFYGYLQGVVMTVSVEIGAFAKNALVLFLSEFWIVVVMRCRKFTLAG